MAIEKSVEMVLKIKPVYVHLIHRTPYMGPCRYGEGEQLERAYDEMMAAENFEKMKKTIQEMYGNDSHYQLLKPVYLPQLDEFILRQEELDLVKPDIYEADVILMEGLMGQHIAVNLAKKFKKTIVAVGCCTSTDVTAGLKAAGFEAYGAVRMEDTWKIMQVLRARKGIRNTRVLSILKGDIISKGVESNITDLIGLTNTYGISFKFMNAGEFLDEIGKLTEEEIKEAEAVADDLIGGAKYNAMSRDYVVRSCKVYVTAKKMLSLYDCNAFTIPCFEICATHRLNNEKYTFCLTHSLLKEEGIPSACEADYSALVAMIVMMNILDNAPHMGNLHPALPHEIPENLKDNQNLLKMFHAVPTRYMHGRDCQKADYAIRSFTAGNWGATIRYDFDQDKDEKITLIRCNPQATGMMAGRATILQGHGYDNIGCDIGYFAEVEDINVFFDRMCEYGHHYVWAYGDVSDVLKKVGEATGFQVEVV